MFKLLTILLVLSLHTLALAQDMPALDGEYDYETGYGDYEPIIAKDGALPWTMFAAVTEIERQKPDPEFDNMTMYWVEPGFTPAVKALDGQHVKFMGYMFPLETTMEQGHFLFGPYPPTCAFHYHVNANQVIEVTADKPIRFSWEPMAIEGRLELVYKDQTGIFYRLHDTKLVKQY